MFYVRYEHFYSYVIKFNLLKNFENSWTGPFETNGMF